MSFRVRQFWRTRLFWFLHLVSQFRRFGLLAVRSRFIREPLAFDAEQRMFGASAVVKAEFLTIAISEIKFGKVAVKVLLAAPLINPDHAAFENAVEALDSIGANAHSGFAVCVTVLTARMIHNAVTGELMTETRVAVGLIGHDVAFARDVLANDRNNLFLGRVLNMEAAGAAFALNEGQHGVLMAGASADLETVLAADVGFVDLDDRARAAHRSKRAISHSLANAVSKKPSGFHAAREHPLDLISRDTLLARAHQMDNLKPKPQRQVRRLKNSALTHGKRLTAFVAVVKAKAGCLAFHLTNALRVSIATVRANWAVRPKLALDIREGGGFIVKVDVIKSRLGHGGISYGHNLTLPGMLCQV